MIPKEECVAQHVAVVAERYRIEPEEIDVNTKTKMGQALSRHYGAKLSIGNIQAVCLVSLFGMPRA